MIDLGEIQRCLRAEGYDGWLLYDFDQINPLATRILKVPAERRCKRRWFYFIPVDGEPVGIVHRIEPDSLAGLPGDRLVYLSYEELRDAVGRVLGGRHRVAMEYSPRAANPYVSRVDGGTIDLVRGAGVEVASSANLVQYFEARWPEAAYPLYREASRRLIAIKAAAFGKIREGLREGTDITEQALCRWIMERMAAEGLVVEEPIVAVGPHTGNPHYQTLAGPRTPISRDQPVLIDLWARLEAPDATTADFTYMAWTGREPPAHLQRIWKVVCAARDAAVALIRRSSSAGDTLQGWQVDEAARGVIRDAGYGDAFVHRTGHSIGRDTHGAGVHMDNLEMRDERAIIPGVAFSIEPGIYLPEYGVRTEVNVLVRADAVEVHEEPMQAELELLG